MATLLEGSKIDEKKLQEIIGSAIDRALINGTFYNDLKRWISKNQQLLRLYYPIFLLFLYCIKIISAFLVIYQYSCNGTSKYRYIYMHHNTNSKYFVTGALMRTKENPGSSTVVNHAPFTLFPSVVPQSLLEHAKGIQKSFNLLMHRVAHDHQFLEQALQKYDNECTLI